MTLTGRITIDERKSMICGCGKSVSILLGITDGKSVTDVCCWCGRRKTRTTHLRVSDAASVFTVNLINETIVASRGRT
jgi:hypothetical protein